MPEAFCSNAGNYLELAYKKHTYATIYFEISQLEIFNGATEC